MIDIVNINEETNQVILTITDDLNWSDSVAHQAKLQEKLNVYFAFAKGGDLVKQYPQAKDKDVVFNLMFKQRPDEDAKKFLTWVRDVYQTMEIALRVEVFGPAEGAQLPVIQ